MQKEASNEIKEGFTRQRRNLMAMTVVMFLVYFWDVEFKSINILGNYADLNKEDNVYFFLWMLWGYWSWRYWNYMSEMSLRIFSVLNGARHRYLSSWLDRACRQQRFWAKPTVTVSGQGDVDVSEIQKIRLDTLEWGLFPHSLRFYVSFTSHPVEGQGDNVTANYSVGWWRALVVNFKAAKFLVNDTRLFSEYILPPLLVVAFLSYWFLCHLLPSLLS